MVFKMRGNPAKRGEIQGTVGHASALKQGLMDPDIEIDPETGIPIDPWGQTGEQTEEEKRAEEIRRIREDMKKESKGRGEMDMAAEQLAREMARVKGPGNRRPVEEEKPVYEAPSPYKQDESKPNIDWGKDPQPAAADNTYVAPPKPTKPKSISDRVPRKGLRKMTFKEAFRKNRDAGNKEFTWNGKRYHTRTKEEEATRKEGKAVKPKLAVKTKSKPKARMMRSEIKTKGITPLKHVSSKPKKGQKGLKAVHPSPVDGHMPKDHKKK